MLFPVTNKWVTNKYESIVDSYNCHRKLLYEKQQQVQQCEWVWMFLCNVYNPNLRMRYVIPTNWKTSEGVKGNE